jgi:hypothetical protein
MVMRRVMYEGDSLIHAAPRASDAEADVETVESSPVAANRRAEAMRGFFPKLSLWISNRIHASRMREVESYLSQATDLADLERRIAWIERSARWH